VISETPALEFVFVLRHAGDAEMKEQKKAFHIRSVREAIARRDANLATIYEDMYQRTIDFGAHPNPHATISAASLAESADAGLTMTIFAITTDPKIMTHRLKSVGQIGLTALRVIEHVFKPRFDQLGISLELDALAKSCQL
jgi:hypothetical protein